MLQIVWEYSVRRGQTEAFEQYYASRGEWANFFRQGAGYLGTTLLRDPDNVQHYATIDLWDSADDYLKFKESFADEYAERDRHCAQFTEDERLVGHFETL